MNLKKCCLINIPIENVLQDMTEYISLCYQYPLIIFKNDGVISFYSVIVELEQKEIDLIQTLITNRTQKEKIKKPFGLSAKKLCSKIDYKPRSKNVDEKYYDKRVSQYKSDIIAKIKNGFKIDKISLQPIVNKNIVEDINGQKFLRGYHVEQSSPYYSFNLDHAINDLIYYSSQTGKKKVCTNFFIPALYPQV